MISVFLPSIGNWTAMNLGTIPNWDRGELFLGTIHSIRGYNSECALLRISESGILSATTQNGGVSGGEWFYGFNTICIGAKIIM